jgi:Ca2+-dependent lipid-binding protein
MDWALSFTPTDVSDITPIQAKSRVNPKIILEIRVGKGVVSTGMPVLLEDICFSGRMRIKMTLMSNFPHVQKVEISFLEQPTFDYVLKPIGGETLGFDINSIPGLAPFIRDQVHGNLGPMMYDPNVFTLDLEQMMSGSPLDAANGVLKIQIIDAKDLKGTKFGGGEPDPYVSLSVGASEAVARTRTIESTTSPTWNETQFVLIKSLNDVLNLNVMDFNDMRSDALLGTVNHELISLGEDAEQEGIVGRILNAGKDRGEMRYNLSYYPAILPEKNPDGTFQPVPDIPSGIARLEILQAKDFGLGNDISAKALIYLGKGKTPIHETKVIKKNASPGWNDHVEFICADKNASVVTARIIDTKSEREIGRVAVRLADILEGKEKGEDWFPLTNSRGAKIRLTAAFKPVNLPGAIDGASTYVPPIGVLRLHLKNAVDVKNVEAMGKSDPYAKVMVGSKTFARTEVCDDTLNPTWDQMVYVPVHSLKEKVTIEIMDYQNIGKDRSLGSVTLNVADTAVENPSNIAYPYQSTGRVSLSERIFLGKNNQYKGTLNFDVDFNPAMSLRGGVSFDAKANDVEEAAKAAAGANGNSPNGTTKDAGAMETLSDTPSDGKASPKEAPKDKDGNPIKEDETEASDPEKGVVMTPEQLVQSQSGVLVFQVIEGTLARKGALEVLFDDGYWPAYTSERARSAHQRWDQVGEGFVRELDFGRTWLRINANDDDDKEDIVAEVQMETRDFLEQALNKEATFILSDPKGNGGRSQIKMSARYVPVDIQLAARESINDQGMLSVTLIGGKGLKGVDRGGKSDPNVTFLLNNLKVFKSETKKKTRDPQWNEKFETVVPSRVRSQFIAQVNDWDRVGSATPMGDGAIDLASMEPFQPANVDVPVMHNGENHGTLQLQMVFRPMIIARKRTNTGAFGGAGRAVTSIGGAALGAPVAVGKGVVGGGAAVVSGVGRGVGTVVGAPGRLFGRNKNRSSSVTQNQPQEVLREVDENPTMGGSHLAVPGYELGQGQAPQATAGQISAPAGVSGGSMPVGQEATTLPPGEAAAPQEPGTLTVSVLSVKDVQPQGSHSASALKPYVAVRVGHKSHKTDYVKGTEGDYNETFSFNLSPGTTQLSLSVYGE